MTAASTVSPSYITQSNPRGRKRSRSPESYADLVQGEDGDGGTCTQRQPFNPMPRSCHSIILGNQELTRIDNADDTKPRKRGRPPKTKGVDSPTMSGQPLTPATPIALQAPQIKTTITSQMSPTQTSPQQSTPGSGAKPAVLKALPTVRDHTTDQLNPEGDEYIAREKDDAGELKVSPNGYLGDREYRMRTFNVPNRGDKLFMLATECARVLGYRDSYLLFNKNRSLYKIIASQPEKDNLIHQEILPYSYRSRQIAIVTARSMFRQFGSRVIVNGRRVRDDYWESKARKQGFTEEDAAGEKRPGAAKQREAAAAEASNNNALTALPHGEIIYSNASGYDSQPAVPPGINPVTLASLPMTSAMSPDDLRSQDFPHIIRPRQEISGPPYQDRTSTSNASDILNQASNSAEFNKSLTQQRVIRSKYLNDYWKRPHEVPEPVQQQAQPDMDVGTVAPQHLHSPQANTNMSAMNAHQNMLAHQQNSAHMMPSQNYAHHQQQQMQNMLAQSPVRAVHQPLPSAQMAQSSPAMSMASMAGRQQTPSYNYSTAGGMWPPPQPQPSPHAMQYGQQHTPQPQQSPMHPPSQLAHQNNNMGYPAMGNQMSNNAYGAGSMNRGMYQPSPSPQQFSMPGQQAGMQGYLPPNSMGGGDWQRYQ